MHSTRSPEPRPLRSRSALRHVTFRACYALAGAVLFLVEVAIALWVRDAVIRPYVGDSLAVVLVYLVLRAVTRLSVVSAVLASLAIAFGIELAQLYHFVDAVGLGNYPAARVVLGTGFDPRDLAAYTAGGVLVLAGEALRTRRAPAKCTEPDRAGQS